MNRKEITEKQIIRYLVTVFILAYLVQGVIWRMSLTGNPYTTLLMIALMYTPFLAVILSGIPIKDMGWMPNLKGKVRYLFFALWLPALLAMLGAVLFFLIFPHTFDTEFATLKASIPPEALAQLEASGMSLVQYALISSISVLSYAPFINMFAALGEEIGWRGALYPYLKERFGKFRGRLIGGVIWGAFHWPLMILTGYEYGKNYFGAPVLGLVVFCLATIVLGILIDHVYEKTQCIFFPSLMHGAVNANTLGLMFLRPEYTNMLILGPLYHGLIGVIPMALLALWISRRSKSAA